ncbi:hypothetical protein R1flu_000390 [Riccia fluitans]|uniref:Uncharacterized protein n=1 Tax=Riccia fluitans TaxID=41844 RepID=A0ABD1Y0C5_9MARC
MEDPREEETIPESQMMIRLNRWNLSSLSHIRIQACNLFPRIVVHQLRRIQPLIIALDSGAVEARGRRPAPMSASRGLKCGLCKQLDHNRRTCPRSHQEDAVHTDEDPVTEHATDDDHIENIATQNDTQAIVLQFEASSRESDHALFDEEETNEDFMHADLAN